VDAAGWDERYGQARQWSEEPNRLAAELIGPLPPGRAVDVAAGEGRMALWLASRGWQVEAVDFSAVGLRRGRQNAPTDVDIAWQVADVRTHPLERGSVDLALVLYLHLPHDEIVDVLRRAAEAVRTDGRLLVLGHDRENLTRGVGGPQDPEILHDVAVLGSAAVLGDPEGWRIDRLEQVDRPTPNGTAVDTLLWAQRR
jgi:ubiquinone/menaquinone biosynthesis C-methylase UbiE